MQTHRLDLNEPPASETPEQVPTTVAVDDPALENHNQQVNPKLRQYSTKTSTPMAKKQTPLVALLTVIVLAIVLGVGTGYAVQGVLPGSSGGFGQEKAPIAQIPTDSVSVGDVFGSPDVETFSDPATGYLESGGIDGEGSHSLLREGGPSQTVYLTSSVTDLSKLEGMEVKVWGETFRGQKAGWLMDVGRVEVIKISGEKPE